MKQSTITTPPLTFRQILCVFLIQVLGLETQIVFFFLYEFFLLENKLQSHGLAEKLSQIHGNSRNLQHKYFNLIF